MQKSMRDGGYAMMGCFGLFWSLITLSFDGMILYGSIMQLRALSFSAIKGTVASSNVEIDNSGEDTSYKAKIKYAYSVNGKEYTGDRLTYGMEFSSHSIAKRTVAAHPAESQIDIYYNPSNPRDSLLEPGLNGVNLFAFIFMLPFNAIMLGIWQLAWSFRRKLPAGGVNLIETPGRTRVRLATITPLIAACATTGGLAFFSCFALAFGTELQTWLVASVLGSIVVIGAVVYGVRRAKMNSGDMDLVIDDAAHAVVIPTGAGRKEPIGISLADVAQIRISSPLPKDSDESPRYLVSLYWKSDKNTRDTVLLETYSAEKAIRFAEWLGDRLKTHVKNDLKER